MLDKEKVKELILTCALSSRMECEKILDLNCDTYNYDCGVCVKKNIEEHSEWVTENKDFYCGDSCETLKKRFGSFLNENDITEEECEICEENIKKYLKKDFKCIFNGFKTGGNKDVG